ncbi:hypothetical protein [Hyphomicrobium sp.]|uniref:hypothetical protein n=1 Tax=Hyphomicrobium sp. TaxID=82 RepID=UPI0025BF8F75|nr:hypothetical protein [Hyphomicrobium sp.]MCC7253143.1 hypothetical protein [Hyphomicrobium sp.]
MGITGVRVVTCADVSRRDFQVGLRSCLTVGLSLACDQVFEDGAAAVARIDELMKTHGADGTLEIIGKSPESIGALRPNPRCSALPRMGVAEMRLMVFQMQLFRVIQDGVVRNTPS